MCNSGLCRLPDDALCRILILLDAGDLLAIERACLRIRHFLVSAGWRIWLRHISWNFASCPVPSLRMLTFSALPYSRVNNSASVKYQPRKITAGPSYFAKVGSISDKLWREGNPTSYLFDQHAEASGPVVRTDGTFVAWTVRSQVKWTCSTAKWPAESFETTKVFSAHTSDLTDLILEEDGQQANITVAGVDGSVACWRVGHNVKHRPLSEKNYNNHSNSTRKANDQNANLCWRLSVAGKGVQRIQQKAGIPHRLISVSHDLQLRVIDTNRQNVVAQTTLPTRPWALQWLADDTLAVGLFGYPGSLAIYRLRPDAIQFDTFLLGHKSSVYGLDACPLAPKLLLSGGFEGETRLWDLRLATGISGSRDSCSAVRDLSSSIPGSYCCVGLFEDRWDDTAVYCCRWDGQRVASGRGRNGSVTFWDTRWRNVTTRLSTSTTDMPSQDMLETNYKCWTKRNGRRWTPVYSICLEQTRVLAALETELWWLDFSGNSLTAPTQTLPPLAKGRKGRKYYHQRRHQHQ
ncbi:WD40-repeat-containing domain protein [Syncephalis fuscata]|nr:WD40-repeat-containing domain protein [Syncephalis fuscata]